MGSVLIAYVIFVTKRHLFNSCFFICRKKRQNQNNQNSHNNQNGGAASAPKRGRGDGMTSQLVNRALAGLGSSSRGGFGRGGGSGRGGRGGWRGGRGNRNRDY